MWDSVSDEPDDLAEFRKEIDAVERSVVERIDPGGGALLIAGAVMVVLVAALLPWIGPVTGWQVLLGDPSAGVLPRVFAYSAFVVGVLGSALGLTVRRWVIAWLCSVGLFASAVSGVLSIWSQQTTTSHAPGPGPGVGLVIAVVAVIVLLVTWLRLAASRPAL